MNGDKIRHRRQRRGQMGRSGSRYAGCVGAAQSQAGAAPDPIIPECANILWKKHGLGQLTAAEASAAAQLLERADIELVAMGAQLHRATELAIELDHPAYDCCYIALALDKDCPFATADKKLLRKAQQSSRKDVAGAILDLKQGAALV